MMLDKSNQPESNIEDSQLTDADVYWCAKDADELAAEIAGRVENYYDQLRDNGILSLWQRCYCAYYNLDYDGDAHGGSEVRFAGEVGEVVLARAGHLRSLIQNMLVMTTAHRLNYQPRAINSDYKSKAQTYAAKSLLDYHEREKRLGKKHKSTALRALLYGMGHLWLGWDQSAGQEVTPETDEKGNTTGRMLHEGDIVAHPKSPIDVIHNLNRSIEDQEWWIVRHPENKYELAEKYPEKARKILDCDGLQDSDRNQLFSRKFGGEDDTNDKCGPDDIYVYHFYRKASPLVPKGRYTRIIDSETWLEDGPLPYEDMPIYTMYPDEFLETSWGYTTAWDLISNDELYDAVLSTIMTTVDAFGVPNVAVSGEESVFVESSRGGLNLIHYPTGEQPPKVLDFNRLDKAMIELLDFIKANSEVRSGVNSVARGQLDSNITSGTMAALVQAQAMHFNSGLEQSYIQLVEDSGTALLRIFKVYGHAPRMILIVGANGQGSVREFTRDNIRDIDRVIVDAGNPLERSIAGKEAMAQTLSERYPMHMTPERYFEVLATGRLDSRRLPFSIVMDLIANENELLASGKVNIDQTADTSQQQAGMMQDPSQPQPTRAVIREVPVLPGDPHAVHIFWHLTEMSDPSGRTEPEVLKLVMTHVHDHLWNKRFSDPELQAIMSQGMSVGQPQAEATPGGMAPLTPEANRPGGDAVPLPGQPKMPASPVAM